MMSDPELSAPSSDTRRVQLLGNDRYAVMITDAGAGYSRWRDVAITRWREDPTCDSWGSFIMLRNVQNGALWSPTGQPFVGDRTRSEIAFAQGCAAFSGERDAVAAGLEVAVAGDFDGEVRRLTLHNRATTACDIELTSYSELVLGSSAADASHPAFSKMFVQTHWEADGEVLLAVRRKRSPEDADCWAAHCAIVDTQGTSTFGRVQYETDRARFLGRGNGLRSADAMQPGTALSNSVGTVLDPIFALRVRVHLPPETTTHVNFWTLAASSRENVLAAVEQARNPAAPLQAIADTAARAHALMAAAASEDRRRTRVDAASRLLAPLLYSDRNWRGPVAALRRGRGGMPTLWAQGISGDRPILLLRFGKSDDLRAIESLLHAHRRWRRDWLGVDLVLLANVGEDIDALHVQLSALKQAHEGALASDTDGAKADVFLLREDQLETRFVDALLTVARAVLEMAADGWQAGMPAGAATAVDRPILPDPGSIRPVSTSEARPDPSDASGVEADLEFFNGLGGFAENGREYRIVLNDGASTPMPWVNVVANRTFGFLVSAEGGGYTWSINSQQNPLTPWPNDPVIDAPGEILYLRDLDSGELWTATAAPIRVSGTRYEVQHGKGWSRFSHCAHDIAVDLLQYVPITDSIKLARLRLGNHSGRPRRLSVTGYVQWALAPNGSNAAPFIVTERDGETGALLAHNAWRAEFVDRVAFMDLGGTQSGYSGDRAAFLGRFGSIREPAALNFDALSGEVGAGLDPCGALQTELTLSPGEQAEVVFMLGDAASAEEARTLVRHYREADLDAVLAEARGLWNEILDTVQVKTPDRAFDLMLNDWLLYQSLGCRIWARSAYYQSSGAYGFRDQLQDVMSVCVSRPDVAREHIVTAAGRQFVEGDVQHWWLPPSGQGVRTRVVDDRLWLALVAAHYVHTTGDSSVLEEQVAFIEGPALQIAQREAFFKPGLSDELASVYEHAARAIDVSLELGPHGLPLMGTGDWNDGMNRVGEKGRGESVWMVWLLVETIEAFSPFADAHGDEVRGQRWRRHAATLRRTVEDAGWDGAWYRRGYYDDGRPLGSSASEECQIDTIAQSWSAIAGASDQAHVVQAMEAVHTRLLHPEDGLALLFTPPFDDGPTDPGYIKGYPPGLRENGGQYTHGAIWSVFAFARLGQGDRAGALFDILNPIRQSLTPGRVERYRVEPYVACADVYSVAPHVGRGGWTWYTGSAGWLYRAGLEAILGFRVQGETLLLEPCIPAAWEGFDVTYRRGSSRYEIAVRNPVHVETGILTASLDDQSIQTSPCLVALRDDGLTHRVLVIMGRNAKARSNVTENSSQAVAPERLG